MFGGEPPQAFEEGRHQLEVEVRVVDVVRGREIRSAGELPGPSERARPGGGGGGVAVRGAWRRGPRGRGRRAGPAAPGPAATPGSAGSRVAPSVGGSGR